MDVFKAKFAVVPDYIVNAKDSLNIFAPRRALIALDALTIFERKYNGSAFATGWQTIGDACTERLDRMTCR